MREVQGRGVGTLMRQAICALFFDELGAHQITSGAYADNPASGAVSRKVGYAPNGTRLELRDGTAARHHKFILDREDFIRPETPISITGASGLRTLLGVAEPTES
jgi:RimJ/RimL family protein N-acetyltransferase